MPKFSVEVVLKAIDQISGPLKSVSANLQKVGAAGVVAGGAITGAFAIAAKTASEFESKMGDIGTLTSGNTQQIEEYRRGVIALGKESPVAINELQEALFGIVSAGRSGEDAISELNSAMKLGVIGLASTQEAAGTLSLAINNFGDEIKNANQASEILFLTQKRGITTVGELSQNFGEAASISKVAGVSFTELQAATAAMTLSNKSASKSQTAIRSAINSLIAPTEDLNKVYQANGIASGEALIKQKGLVGALQFVQQAAKGNTGEMKKLLSSQESLNAANVLLGEQLGSFNDILGEMRAATGGAVDEEFNRRLQETDKRFKLLINNLQTLVITIGSDVAPMFNVLLDAALKVVDVFQKMPSGTRKAIVAFTAITGAALLIGGTLAVVVGGVLSFIGSISAGVAAIAPFIATLGGVWAGITAVGASIAALLPAIGSIGAAFLAIVNPVTLTIAAVVAGAALVMAKWDVLGPFFKNLWDGIVNTISMAMGKIMPMITNALNAIGQLSGAGNIGTLAATGSTTGAFVRQADPNRVAAAQGNLNPDVAAALNQFRQRAGREDRLQGDINIKIDSEGRPSLVNLDNTGTTDVGINVDAGVIN